MCSNVVVHHKIDCFQIQQRLAGAVSRDQVHEHLQRRVQQLVGAVPVPNVIADLDNDNVHDGVDIS